MDKFEMEQFTQIRDVVADLQLCFVDGDAFSRIPSAQEWRHATRLTHRLTLLCFELHGYATATRQYNVVSIRERLHFVPQNPTKPTLQEVNDMLVQLNLSLKARERADGRFEIRPTINGKKHSIYGKSADELVKKYKQLLKLKKEQIEPKSKITLFSWLDEWLEIYKKPHVAKNTFGNLERCVRCQIKANLEDKPLNRYTVNELTKAINNVPTTRMRKYARGTLSAAFDCAVMVGHLKESPAAKIPQMKHVSKKGKAFALLDLKEMLEAAPQHIPAQLLHYYIFCLFAGTRRDEALYITGGDFDLKNKIIYIRGTKTETSERRIPMFPVLEKIFNLYKPSKFERLFTVGKHRTDGDFKLFKGAEREGTLHSLRHSFGTIQICALGIPANTVALWMGHATASTTVDKYTHPEDLAPDIYFSATYSETEKAQILRERYNEIVSAAEKLLELPPI